MGDQGVRHQCVVLTQLARPGDGVPAFLLGVQDPIDHGVGGAAGGEAGHRELLRLHRQRGVHEQFVYRACVYVSQE
jgi:hypothetical protein